MTDQGQFWDSIADKYAKQPVADQAAYEKKLAVTRGYMRPDMEVLEIGCGTGTTALHHAPAVKHIRAVDIAPRMIEIARDKARAAGVSNVDFEVSTIDGLQVPDGSLDMVMAHSILHLVDDKDAVIARIHRMLKPGGLFVSSTVCLADSPLLAAIVTVVAPVGRLLGKFPRVLRAFSAQALVRAMTQAGFAIDHQWQPGKTKAAFIVAKKV